MASIIRFRNLKADQWPGGVQKPKAFGWNLSPPYEGSSHGRRTSGWNPGSESVNSVIYGNVDILRARSRDAIRKNAWAANASETFVSEAIGTGIKPQSKHADVTIKGQLQELWLDWTDYADAHQSSDFYGMQSLAMRSIVEGGECFARFRQRRPSDGLPVPLQIQLLEAEHCPIFKNETLPNGNVIRAGIEFDRRGQRLAYWLYPNHPGEFAAFSIATDPANQPVRVPADQILHLFRPIRPGQVRGEPWLSRALIRLYDYDKYTDAELMRKQIAAMFCGFITEPDPEFPVLPTTTTVDGQLQIPNMEPPGVSLSTLEPGTMQNLRPGEQVQFSNPTDVGPNFEAFNRACLREIATATGLTYEQLSNDLSGVNYSSIRAGLLAFRRKVEQIQHQVMVFKFCDPVWRYWINMAVQDGSIKSRDFRRNTKDYYRVKWIAPGWTWVDPQKEVEANKSAVRNLFKSLPQVVSEQGYDIEEIIAETKAAYQLMDEAGIIADTDPRQTSDTGMRPSKDPTNPDGLEDPEGPPPTPPAVPTKP